MKVNENQNPSTQPSESPRPAPDGVMRYLRGLITGHHDEAKVLIPVIKQLCRDLNDAHNEILREQGVPDDHFNDYDWPEWTPQANSIRWAERILKIKLAKTNNWTMYPTVNAPERETEIVQD